MKSLRVKGLAELVDAIHGLRHSFDALSEIVGVLAAQSEGCGPGCEDDEDDRPHGPPKKKGPKKKHPKKKAI
jgi:hypothetical protein